MIVICCFCPGCCSVQVHLNGNLCLLPAIPTCSDNLDGIYFIPSSNLLKIDFSARDPSNFGSMQTASGRGGGMMLMMPSAILKSCLFSRCQVREFASNCWASEQTDGEVDVAQSQRVPWQMKFGPEISGPWVVG